MTVNWSTHRLKMLIVLTAARMLVGTIAGAHPDPHPTVPPPDQHAAAIHDVSAPSPLATLHQARAFYQARIRRNPTDGIDRAALANVYIQLARATGNPQWYDQAAQTAQASLERLPFNNPGAQLVLARVAAAQHDFAETLRLTTTVLQTQPNHPDALGLQVTTHLAQGNLTAADRVAHTLVNQTPTLGTWTLLALVHEAQGQDQAALQAFAQALRLAEPDALDHAARTHTLLGRLHARRGAITLARQQYQQALTLHPQSTLTQVYLAALDIHEGHLQRAADRYTEIYRRPDVAQGLEHVALQSLAQVKALQGDRDSAAQFWQQAEAHLRHDHDSHTFGHRRDLAQLLLARGHSSDLPEALALMAAEVQLRQDAQTLDTWAWALSKAERWQEAQQVLQDAITAGTQDAGIVYRAGLVAEALGQREAATAYFQQAQALNPNFNQRDRQLLGMT